MNELLEFLTSGEIMIVYCVALVASLLCVIIYIVEKNNDGRRKRQNTKELNKLVEQIKEEIEVEKPVSYSEEPVLYTVDHTEEPILYTMDHEESAVNELLEPTIELESITDLGINEEVEEIAEPVIIEPIEIEEEVKEEPVIVEEQLEYTTIEPDEETAKLELQKLTEELQKQESIEDLVETSVNKYEESQEENAIISLDELLSKGKEIYEANEINQYDEENEPISIQELGNIKEYTEPFVMENVMSAEEKLEVEQEVQREKVHLDDFYTINENSDKVDVIKFKSSPFISPVFGIEKSNELELENTANFEKFDQEIKKTNEFITTLKELQDKLN